MVNILIASGGMRVFDEFWGFVVVNNELNDIGVKTDPARVQKLKDALITKIAPDWKSTGDKDKDLEQKNQIITQALYKQGITTNPEIEWYFGTYAGLQILAENAEAAVPGTIKLTEEEKNKAMSVAFGKSVVVLDFICKDKSEADEVIKMFNVKGTTPEQVAQAKHPVQPLRIAKEDDTIPKVFQDEIWTNLKGAKDAYSTVAQLDQRTNMWHVLYIQATDPGKDLKDVKQADKDALLAQLEEKKQAQWRAARLEKLKQKSAATIEMRDPILKQQLEAMRSAATQRAAQPATSAPAATAPSK
jgi:hypothetical protein